MTTFDHVFMTIGSLCMIWCWFEFIAYMLKEINT